MPRRSGSAARSITGARRTAPRSRSPEDILKELITSVLRTVHTEDSVHHIEMHPGNRVLFVFQDGHTEEHFWEDHSRRDSWDAEKRQKAAEKTRIQHQKRKEQEQ